MNDLRFAVRSLAKSPAFVFVCVATLALGIGANTAIFTVINGVLLRPLPYVNPARLFTLRSQQSAPELADLAEQSKSFECVGGIGTQAVDYLSNGEPTQVEIGLVANDFFRVLGARAALGRTLGANDDRFGGEHVLVLSYNFWQRQFAGDAGIIGQSIVLAGQSYTVVGVTAQDFRPPLPNLEAYAPIRVFYRAAAESRGAHLLHAYLRLKPNISLGQAQSEMRVIDDRFAFANPDENKNRQTVLISLQERMTGEIRPALLILFGAVGLVLLIACANFANLLLARISRRRQELNIRAALGASRAQLIGQILTESIVLAVLGGGAGLLIGSWGVEGLLALQPADLPRAENIHLDGAVFGFTFALAILTGVMFGAVSAWPATRVDPSGVLSLAGRSVTVAPSRWRNLLVVTELGLAMVLLVGAGLLGNAFWRLTSVSPGFNPANVSTLRVELPATRYKEVATQTSFRNRVLDRLNELPGARAAIISELPLGGNAINHNFIIEGRPPLAVGEEPELYNRSIAGDYFQVMGIPLLRGRALTSADRAETQTVGVINDSMARQYFRGRDPIGARIRWARSEGVEWITIVGVVGDVRHFGLAFSDEPAIYTPYAQSGQSWKRWSEIVVRGDRSLSAPELKSAIWRVDPLVPIPKVQSMSDVMSVSLAERRFNMILLAVFATLALVLASIGLYGVLTFTVAERTREIGIRIAVGAQTAHIVTLVLGQGLTLTLLGVVTGIAASLAGTRLLAGLLYGVRPTDPATFISVAFLLITIALLACLLPARRAMRVDPIVALRNE